MGKTNIEWADFTFNPWKICTPVSPGCVNCYAAAMAKRFGWGEYRKGVPRQRTSETYWKQPLMWNQTFVCDVCGAPTRDKLSPRCSHCGVIGFWRKPRVFCASLADVFDPEAPDQWRDDLFQLIVNTPNLDWLFLTKRPENALQIYNDLSLSQWNGIKENLWLGVSVENQEQADKRIPELLKIPAKVRFLSMEPLLGPVNLENYFERFDHSDNCENDFCALAGGIDDCDGVVSKGVDWVIVGGESGPGKRKFETSWAYSLRDQCKAASVPFFMKQIDKVQPIPEDLLIREFPRTPYTIVKTLNA